MVIFLERSKNRTVVFSSILGTISCFFMCMTVWSFFGVHGSMYLPWNLLCLWPWALPSGLTELVALGFALWTCCARGLRLCPQDLLRSWPCLGFALRTRCSRNFFLYYTNYLTPGAMCEVPPSLWWHLTHQCSHNISTRPGGQQLRRGERGTMTDDGHFW